VPPDSTPPQSKFRRANTTGRVRLVVPGGVWCGRRVYYICKFSSAEEVTSFVLAGLARGLHHSRHKQEGTLRTASGRMSATATQKLPGESSPTGPTFSYAQAAKGRSPSVPSVLSSSRTSSENMNVSARSTSAPGAKEATAIPVKNSVTETPSDAYDEVDAKVDSKDSNTSDLELTPKNATSVLPSSALAQLQPTASAPSSPSFGTASTSTLPKEDELSSTANGSSDSNWDKNSQSSQNGSKPSEKTEDNKLPNPASTWNDESPQSALLKEAPPPAVNFWQHRKEIQEAKAKTKQGTGIQAPKLTTHFGANGSINNGLQNPESGLDSKKQESKKKTKSSSTYVEEKSSPGNNKEGYRAGEGRPRGLEEGVFWNRSSELVMLTTDSVGEDRLSRLPNARCRKACVCPKCPATTSWGRNILAYPR
jgi:hypothetical protein